MCVCVYFSVLIYPEPYIKEIALFLFLGHCSHICISRWGEIVFVHAYG